MSELFLTCKKAIFLQIQFFIAILQHIGIPFVGTNFKTFTFFKNKYVVKFTIFFYINDVRDDLSYIKLQIFHIFLLNRTFENDVCRSRLVSFLEPAKWSLNYIKQIF